MKIDDKLLDEHVKKKAQDYKNSIVIPEPSNWEQVNAAVKRHVKQKSRMRTIKQLSSIAAAAILISAVISGGNNTVSADLSTFLKQFKNEITYIFVDKSVEKDRTSIHISQQSEDSPLDNNAEVRAALEVMSFKANLPTYIPENFEVYEVSRTLADEALNSLKIGLVNPENQLLIIDYVLSEFDFTSVKQSDKETTSDRYEETIVNGYNAIYLNREETITVSWLTKDNIRISIFSDLDLGEVMRIANSIEK